MMIYIFSGRWSEPQIGPNHTEPDGRLIPVSRPPSWQPYIVTMCGMNCMNSQQVLSVLPKS